MKATVTNDIEFLGTDITLKAGEEVFCEPATNQPDFLNAVTGGVGKYFVSREEDFSWSVLVFDSDVEISR
jgi:hypothetical protein